MATREGSPVIGTAELFENERVKVWDFVLEGSDLEVEYGDGRRQSYSPKPGDVHWARVDGSPAHTHDARNVGTTRYRNLIVELKEP